MYCAYACVMCVTCVYYFISPLIIFRLMTTTWRNHICEYKKLHILRRQHARIVFGRKL